jgi:hypothetical protein
MHENKFETQVQEKMNQLGFDPPEAVWVSVDKEINQDKERRKPLFWIFFLTGIMLAGGYYFLSQKNDWNGQSDVTKGRENKKAPGNPSNQNSNTKSSVSESGIVKKDETSETDNNKIAGRQAKSLDDPILFNSGEKKSATGKDSHSKQTKIKKAESGLVAGTEELPAKDINQPNKTSVIPDIKENRDLDSSETKKKTDLVKKTTISNDSVVKSKVAKNLEKQVKSSVWKFGLSTNTGLSEISPAFHNSSSNNFASNVPPNSGASNYTGPSKISTGFSFSAGLLVTRNLSKRIFLSAGINYHYYSVTFQTGTPVDSSVLVLYSASALPVAINGFYRNGNVQTYTNQYHFIELPLSVNFQLNKNEKQPLIWEAGFSLSYLLKGNALEYDASSNVYVKNNALFNRTQLNTATAILFGIPLGRSELLLGPQIQYGLSSLLKSAAGDPQHFLSYGLKISFLMSKK